MTAPVQSNLTAQSTSQMLPVPSQPCTLSQNKELKACLTGSRDMTNSANVTVATPVLNNVAQHTVHPYFCPTSGQIHPSSVVQSVQNQFQTLTSVNLPVSASHLTTVAHGLNCNGQQIPFTQATTTASIGSDVSSPGLAFLAQVSSLSSGQEFKTLSKDARVAFSASLNPQMSADVNKPHRLSSTPQYEIQDSNEGIGHLILWLLGFKNSSLFSGGF